VFTDSYVSIAFYVVVQMESRVNCSLPLALFNFRFCWFSELIMLAFFLALVGLSISLEFYSFLTSCICDCFSFSSMCIILSSILYNVGLVDMKCFSLSLSWMVFISSSRLKDRFSGRNILGWQLFSLRA
jgi:hypothetical protein